MFCTFNSCWMIFVIRCICLFSRTLLLLASFCGVVTLLRMLLLALVPLVSCSCCFCFDGYSSSLSIFLLVLLVVESQHASVSNKANKRDSKCVGEIFGICQTTKCWRFTGIHKSNRVHSNLEPGITHIYIYIFLSLIS